MRRSAPQRAAMRRNEQALEKTPQGRRARAQPARHLRPNGRHSEHILSGSARREAAISRNSEHILSSSARREAAISRDAQPQALARAPRAASARTAGGRALSLSRAQYAKARERAQTHARERTRTNTYCSGG